MGYRPGSEAAGVMLGSVGSNWPAPVGGRTMAHELGHNLGRKHVLCTGDEPAGGDVDYSYPYPGTSPCRIASGDADGYYGLMVPTGATDPVVVLPSGTGDLMSYGDILWVSDWTYRALFDQLDVAAGVEAAAVPESWVQAGEYLMASGFITPGNSTADFSYFYRRDEAKSSMLQQSWEHSLAASGAYSLALRGAGDALLYTHSFSPTVSSEGVSVTTTVFFGEVFPYISTTQRIVLYGNGLELASRAVSAASPVVTIQAPAGGEVFAAGLSIVWTASDADAGDVLQYAVQYSSDDGANWQYLASGYPSKTLTLTAEDMAGLPGSSRARVRVLATDGVNTGQAVSNRFTVSRHPPEAHITTPPSGAVVMQEAGLALRGVALDAEDGALTDPAALTWTSDISGTLGTGPELLLSGLPFGVHRFTLTARDSDLMTATARVTVTVAMRSGTIYLPLVTRGF
jgi:hypothetical protein